MEDKLHGNVAWLSNFEVRRVEVVHQLVRHSYEQEISGYFSISTTYIWAVMGKKTRTLRPLKLAKKLVITVTNVGQSPV